MSLSIPRRRTTGRLRRPALAITAGMLAVSSVGLLGAARADVSVVKHQVTFTPDYSKITGFGADGGTIRVPYTPSFPGGTPNLTACKISAVQPITMDFAISDQRPTNAYAGTPDLKYSWWYSRAMAGNGAVFGVESLRGTTPLAANTGWNLLPTPGDVTARVAAVAKYLNPTITNTGGALKTAPFVPYPQAGANFVPTQMFTVTAGAKPALQTGITDYPVKWHTDQWKSIAGSASAPAGTTDLFGMVGAFNGKAALSSPDMTSGDTSTLATYWAEAKGASINPGESIGARIVIDSFSTTLACESGGSAVIDSTIGMVAGSVAIAATAGAALVVGARRRRARREASQGA